MSELLEELEERKRIKKAIYEVLSNEYTGGLSGTFLYKNQLFAKRLVEACSGAIQDVQKEYYDLDIDLDLTTKED